MPDLIKKLATEVASRIQELGFDEPSRTAIAALLDIAYLGTLRSEEGRFVKGSLTFANPMRPEIDPPFTRRANYPAFIKFDSIEILTVQTLVKLARAIDRWSGSIAVHSTRRGGFVAWGVVDQLVEQNVWFHRESDGGFVNPGLLTVTMDGIGDISVYHGSLFLGGLKAQNLVTRESDALNSNIVSEHVFHALEPFAKAIARVLDSDSEANIGGALMEVWATSIARLCIGLRQHGTGGAFLLTPTPIRDVLQVKHPLTYSRLRDAAILNVLDEGYRLKLEDAEHTLTSEGNPVPAKLAKDLSRAETDAEDRRKEVTGAVKLVTSFASVDGCVLMTPELSVSGFGVKIGSTPNVSTVYDGTSFASRGTRARKIDLSQFGTRHGSMLRYCAQDRKALGIVVSQDGYVRLIMTVKKSLLLWDNIKLLGHQDFSQNKAAKYKERRRRLEMIREAKTWPFELGYTETPKTIDQLMKATASQQKH
ncbi:MULTISPECIES: putative sensor domain DACNV-containing protein [unclassified Bradyrhizobium]|uniref:putative sensor domain DACNV-containing protein n=1 Tax=unclassified Bradyrhizobium TaxID=2631580 RepID=UPI002916F52C|nr:MULTISPECIES: hypothetical protein [unclassified Bradyrhizobium]